MSSSHGKKVLGWREWVELPALHIRAIKVKVDSGARTSALHAEDIHYFTRRGQQRVRFKIFPLQRGKSVEIHSEAEVIETRIVRSSIGHETERPVIRTYLRIGDEEWPIEVTLVNRDIMGFRMLLGRQAIRQRYVIDPGSSFLQSQGPTSPAKKKKRKKKKKLKS